VQLHAQLTNIIVTVSSIFVMAQACGNIQSILIPLSILCTHTFMSISFYLSIYLSIYLFIYLSIYLYIYSIYIYGIYLTS